jgi:hypothetical protein
VTCPVRARVVSLKGLGEVSLRSEDKWDWCCLDLLILIAMHGMDFCFLVLLSFVVFEVGGETYIPRWEV